MSCPRQLTLSIYADGELEAVQAARLERHLDGCASCSERVAGLRREADLLRTALELPPLLTTAGRAGTLRLLPWAAATLGLAAVLRVAWAAVGGLLSELPHWLNPLELAGSLNLLFNSIFFLARSGGEAMSWSTPMISSTLALLATGLAAGWVLRQRPRATLVALALPLLAILAAPAGAVEMRRGDLISVTADEVIDGSLLLAGETIRVEGTVNGDLIAFGRNVTVRGDVSGGIYAFAQNVDVSGGTGGSVHLFAQWVRLAGSAAGSGYMFAQGVALLPGSRVDGDVLMFGETLEAEGGVGRDVLACGARVELRGEVGRNVQVWTDHVSLSDSAILGGDLIAHLPSGELASVADGATVGGEVTVEPVAPQRPKNRWTTPGFYLWKLVGLIGALLVGAILWWLAPDLLGGRLGGGGAVLARVAVGLLVLVATPVALIVVGLTLIGLPLALIGLALYLVALYLAGILTADLLGRALLGWPEETLRGALPALALGLAILTAAELIPWLGGVIGFLALLLGLGLLAWRLWRRASKVA